MWWKHGWPHEEFCYGFWQASKLVFSRVGNVDGSPLGILDVEIQIASILGTPFQISREMRVILQLHCPSKILFDSC
jgi:hypothetical protein